MKGCTVVSLKSRTEITLEISRLRWWDNLQENSCPRSLDTLSYVTVRPRSVSIIDKFLNQRVDLEGKPHILPSVRPVGQNVAQGQVGGPTKKPKDVGPKTPSSSV